MNIIEAMTDRHLFGDAYGDDSFDAWRALLAGFYGLPMDADALDTYQSITGRQTAPTVYARRCSPGRWRGRICFRRGCAANSRTRAGAGCGLPILFKSTGVVGLSAVSENSSGGDDVKLQERPHGVFLLILSWLYLFSRGPHPTAN